MASETSNPPTRDILANHELASRTINQHGTDLAIFDDDSLRVLRRFVMDPSPATREAILKDPDLLDDESTPADQIGAKAVEAGDLAKYVIARYGMVDNYRGTLSPQEVEQLKEWFARDGPSLG